jgi:OmpA-OmpF porin, OOP family
VLKRIPLRIAISGHTDNLGDRVKNLELAQQRAESVKAYLVQQGTDASRIETRGAGPTNRSPTLSRLLVVRRPSHRFKLLQK